MLSFVVFDADGIDARNFPPRHAWLIGPDDIPLQGDIELAPGMVSCEKTVAQTVGLAVQFPVPSPANAAALAGANLPSNTLGLLALQSCLLPDRTAPYLLSLELARHRIMLFLNKLEDWGLFDLTADQPVMQQFEQARAAFTQALVAQRATAEDDQRAEKPVAGFSPRADHLAGGALSLAINASEGLAMVQAERQLKARLSGRGYADAVAHLARLTPETLPATAPILVPGSGQVVLPSLPQIGVAISPGQFTEAQQKAALAAADFVTMPMRWVDMEPSEGKYAFTATDRWIEWAVRTAKLPVVGGPLVDFRPQCTPEWLLIWENDYETLRDLVFEHVQAVVTRYRRTVTTWTVASGLHVNTNFKISFEQIMDLTRMCVLLVRKLQPTAKVQLEIAQPWGEYHAHNRRSIPPFMYAEAALASGLNIDAISLRLQMGNAQPGFATRDLMCISALLDRFGALEKPVAVTALGAPSSPVPPKPVKARAGAEESEPYEPGYWRSPWSEAAQAEWLNHALAICCSKPFVTSVCWHELADPAPATTAATASIVPEIPFGGLLHPNGQAKQSLTRLTQFRGALRDRRLPAGLGAAPPR